MIRTQIQLTRKQHSWLKRWAKDRGISLSEAVRRSVDQLVAEEMTEDRHSDRVRKALSVVGKYSDPTGASTIGRDHDTYLTEAYRK